MAFVVEDGSGLATANSYASVAYADSYFLDRGVSSWTGSNSAKEAALIQATDYVETRWGLRFMGLKANLDLPQALSFPRSGLVDRSGVAVFGIPDNLKKATCEYAVRALVSPLYQDPEISSTGLVVVSKREKVGPLEEETKYQTAESSAVVSLSPYPAADRLLDPYLLPAGTNYR